MCCGQVGALKRGPGQVAGLNVFGVAVSEAPKSDEFCSVHPPGMRGLSKRKLSTIRNRSLTKNVSPRSAVVLTLRADAGTRSAMPYARCRLREVNPLKF